MLIGETFAAAVPLTRFRGLARVLEKRACMPSSERVPGVVHPLPRASYCLNPALHAIIFEQR